MGLSNNLISKFVKATKDEQEPNKETTVYGTVQKDQNGDLRVQLDGSDILTPVKSTVVLAENDRVTVMIKNHTATVTGNLTNPAASDGDTVRVWQLEAEKVRVNDLVAANADIQGTLDAQNAVINNLDATYASISYLNSKYLTADDIKTDYLSAEEIDADYATIDSVKSTYATIDELTAVKGDIKTLNSEIANIDTLIFGSATGNIIQTSFSNSVIAQLGDAQIKSAMIESVSADKITAGDIITNNVRVISEDGSLVISDETLQISDGTNVRVQIGKDADDDYSINIWDQNGNLMFSKGGITDSAIKEAIIRNDMVSDTANIHASKLDIDSLFEEINGSSNTIKSTQIYLDEENQTLTTAFKSLTTEVTEQGKTISSQGTQITENKDAIESKVWLQDINTAKNEMSTQYSTLEQDVDSFKTTVSKTYATISDTTNLNTRMTTVEQTADSLSVELENLEIGGRNLLKNSKLVAMYSNNPNVYPISCIETTENGVTFYRVKRTNIEAYPSTVLSMFSTLHKDSFMYGHMTGKQVTLSFKARVSHEITGSFMDFTYGGESVVDFGKSNETFTTDWKTYYVTINSFPDMTNHTGIRWSPRQFQLTADILEDFYLDIRDFKFELGNKPTDWTPAPEDVESDILEASKSATNYLEFSSSGLVIGDMTTDTLGKNVLIDSDSVDIRNGNTTLASFGADYLYLAKNSRNAKIDLCNGLATMYHESKYSYDTMFIIDTGNTTEIMGLITPLCVTSTDDLDNVSIQFANANGVMGGIGIVGSYLRRFGSNMYDNYTILDKGNFDDVMDSGWLTAIPADGFTLYNTSQPIQYRKIGKIVSLNGTVSPMTEIAGSTTTHTICTLPEGYRPSRSRYFVCYGSNNYTWRLTINTSGAVQFSRYGLDSGYVTAGTNHWLNFNVTFFTD